MSDVDTLIRKQSVCFISPSAYPLLDPAAGEGWTGGAEAQLVSIARNFSADGMDTHFIVGDMGQPDLVEFDGIKVHRATFRYMGGSNKYVLPDWWRIFSILGKIRPDYIIIKVPRHLLFVLGLHCKLRGGHVIFVGQKDNDFDEAIIRSHEGAPGWWFYKLGLKMVSAIAAQTETQQAGFKQVFGNDSVVIRNVLTLEADDNIVKEDYVLWVGNSSEDKQPHLIIDLARALPDIPFRMIMSKAGSRPDDSFITSRLHEVPNLEYLGTVPFTEIAPHYKKARIFISTSRCEGFPNTFLQAWQYRTPVVSLMISPDEVVQRHELGRVSGTVENMAADIGELYSNRELCEQLGENAWRYAYAEHSLETALERYRNIFRGLSSP